MRNENTDQNSLYHRVAAKWKYKYTEELPGLGMGNIQGTAIKAKGHNLWEKRCDQQCQGAEIQENGGWFGVSQSGPRMAGMEFLEKG